MRLREANQVDIPLLKRWDKEPHVIAANPNDVWDWDEEMGHNPAWRDILMAEVDQIPIGVVQVIDPALEESHYWGDIEANMRAIDIWIGDADKLGLGIGTRIMNLVLERCFTQKSVTAILVDPLKSNHRACNFYQKLGFRHVGDRLFGEDLCAVYSLSRQEYDLRS